MVLMYEEEGASQPVGLLCNESMTVLPIVDTVVQLVFKK